MPPHDRAITLHGLPGAPNVAAENVFFVFEDGRLDYDCVTCGAQCCRGHGFHVQRSELEDLLSLRPDLALFVEPRSDLPPGMAQVSNCKPACFFLDSCGGCTVHVTKGYSAKPETCRLFPFNRLGMLEDFLVVGPHENLCPLTVVDSPSVSGRSSHGNLISEMMHRGIAGAVPRIRPAPGRTAVQVIALERAIVQLSQQHTDGSYEAFVTRQRRVTAEVSGITVFQSEDGITGKEEGDFLAEVSRVLAQDLPLSDDAALIRTMVSVTPILRAEMLVWPRHSGAYAIAPELAPSALLALWCIVCIARRAGLTDVTYQGIHGLFKRFESLIYMLALADQKVVITSGRLLDAPMPNDREARRLFINVMKGLVGNAGGRGGRLSDLIVSNCQERRGPRSIRLKLVAPHLLRWVRIANAKDPGVGSLSAREFVQRWMFRNMDERTLMLFLDRRHDRAKTRRLPSPSLS